ncbi:hypothetical protein PPERSA_02272 [Pseudocohnilembus persalinus]|uniref:Tubulin--tyrosine ligase-like protein 5 n=1 Tax=Pseudocohnilembus persalinus TaxID=266149 RepID=A0A0V0QKK6_PSEPJ|nr:hypothetical protein PPERSA_02272 [Pseudocohnilembus persalinus]|eukprot:KRX02782.1 hypothetical protein PPERSA_02272 [Pseudocohnilembus persalinus]
MNTLGMGTPKNQQNQKNFNNQGNLDNFSIKSQRKYNTISKSPQKSQKQDSNFDKFQLNSNNLDKELEKSCKLKENFQNKKKSHKIKEEEEDEESEESEDEEEDDEDEDELEEKEDINDSGSIEESQSQSDLDENEEYTDKNELENDKGQNCQVSKDDFMRRQVEYQQQQSAEGDFEEQNADKSVKDDKNKVIYNNRLILLKSIYQDRPPTILFDYPYYVGKQRKNERRQRVSQEDFQKYQLQYKTCNFKMVSSIENIFALAGFERVYDDENWNFLWGIGQHKKIRDMTRYQKTNHFPGCYNLGRKDFLWRHLSKVKRKYPKDYNFVPNTYILSSSADWDKFLNQKEMAQKNHLWIMKPCGSAQGKGIKILNKNSKVKQDADCLICEYVANPHLIDGLKYDLRIYVLVTSYNPLRVYIFEEGLVRFASEKYTNNLSQLKTKYVHLTNYAVNKMNARFLKNQDPDKDNVGNKWSIRAYKQWFEDNNLDHKTMFQQMHTCISCEPYMSDMFLQSQEHRKNCVELYGFDILIDDKLKPWLLEANVQPSLRASSPLDRRIKHSLVADIFTLAGLVPYDKQAYETDLKNRIPGSVSNKGEFFKSKNIQDLKDLNFQNCTQKLSLEDWAILVETDEENYRTGGFTRLYPSPPVNISEVNVQQDYSLTNEQFLENFIIEEKQTKSRKVFQINQQNRQENQSKLQQFQSNQEELLNGIENNNNVINNQENQEENPVNV